MAYSITERVAAEVRAELARRKLSRRDLESILGLSQPSVARRVNGDTPFNLAELEQICEWLSINPGDLVVAKQLEAS